MAGICVRLARVVVSRKHAPHVVHSIGGKNRCDLLTVWAVRLLASLLPSFSPCWFDRSFVGPFVRSFVRSSVPSFLPSSFWYFALTVVLLLVLVIKYR